MRIMVRACICTARSVPLFVGSPLQCSRRGLLSAPKHRQLRRIRHHHPPLFGASSCLCFFFLWSASETEVPRADDNRLLRHFGGSLAMLRAIALHRKWCLRRTVCVVSSCGLVSSQFRFLFCFLFLAIFFCPPARVSVVLLLPVCGVCLRCGPCVYYVHIVVYIV